MFSQSRPSMSPLGFAANIDRRSPTMRRCQKTGRAMSKSNSDFIVVTAMKNEGPYILEWVAHHFAIGFGHFIVVTNDCEDGTDEILLALQRRGLVTHAVNPRVLTEDVGKWQIAALKFAQYYPAYRQAKWILHSDVDEFVHLESPLTQISDLVQQLAPVDAISLTSCPYSGDNRVELRDEPVCDQFGMMSRVPAPDTLSQRSALEPAAEPSPNHEGLFGPRAGMERRFGPRVAGGFHRHRQEGDCQRRDDQPSPPQSLCDPQHRKLSRQD